MNMVAPSNQLGDRSGDYLTFNVPYNKADEIAPLFKLIEEESDQLTYDTSTD